MSTSERTAGETPSLRDFSGLLVLVGAGKMGGALLEGWLRLGLDPKRVAVLEPSRRRRSQHSLSAACSSIRNVTP